MAEVATRVAETLTGNSQLSLRWLEPVVINDHIDDADDEETWGLTDTLCTDPAQLSLDPEEVALSDVLEVAHSDDQDKFEPELEVEIPSRITTIWELPEVGGLLLLVPA